MYNLLKSEIYKMFRSKTYKWIMLVSVLSIGLTLYASFSEDMTLQLIYGHYGNRGYGFEVMDLANIENLKAIDIFNNYLGLTPVTVICLSYLVGYIVCSEYKKGTYRNSIIYGHKRSKIYISKLITSCVGIFIPIIIGSIFTIIIGSAMKGFDISINLEDTTKMIKLSCTMIVIYISLASLFTFLSTLIKNDSIIASMGFILFILPTILLTNGVTIEQLNYIPTFMMMDICAVYPSNEIIMGIIGKCSIITLLTTLIGIKLLNNQDIK